MHCMGRQKEKTGSTTHFKSTFGMTHIWTYSFLLLHLSTVWTSGLNDVFVTYVYELYMMAIANISIIVKYMTHIFGIKNRHGIVSNSQTCKLNEKSRLSSNLENVNSEVSKAFQKCKFCNSQLTKNSVC